MPANSSVCMTASCMSLSKRVRPAGFQAVAVASLTLAATAPLMPIARPPTPIAKNSLLYFGAWERAGRATSKAKQERFLFSGSSDFLLRRSSMNDF